MSKLRPDPEFEEVVRAAPKVELHLHLDGAMAVPWLLGWAALVGVEGFSIPSRPEN